MTLRESVSTIRCGIFPTSLTLGNVAFVLPVGLRFDAGLPALDHRSEDGNALAAAA